LVETTVKHVRFKEAVFFIYLFSDTQVVRLMQIQSVDLNVWRHLV